jgi:hypothetical protein
VLARQQEVCASLSMLLSSLSEELAGQITSRHFSALAGSVDILDTVYSELQQAYSGLEELADNE